LFTLAVVASAVRGGLGPGLLSTVLGAFGGEYFFPPKGTFLVIAPEYLPVAERKLVVFLVVGVIVSWLSGELRHLRWEAVGLAAQRNESLESLQQTLAERDAALERVQLLSGLLPICAACKKIRDEEGNWQQIESYISKHSEAKFSHGMCPACGKQYYGELWPEKSKDVR
jgi:K+-sensing histidine kinase KdpD